MKKLSFYLLPLFIALVCTALVAFTIKDYGISADEPIHLNQAELHMQWFQHPSLQTIDMYWNPVDGHPPFFKIVGAITIWLFHSRFPITDVFSAFRIAVLPFVFLLVFMMTLYASGRYGKSIGAMAGILAVTLPRVFFEAHQGAFDFPVMVLVFVAVIATIYAKTSWKWFLVSVVCIGLALSTKVQGIYYYLSILGYWLFYSIKTKSFHTPESSVHARMKLFLSVLIPPVIFYALWPYLWLNSWTRICWYLNFLLTHVSPPVYYLGHIYTNVAGNYVPWHYVWTLTATTIPGLLLLFICVGIFAFVKNKKDVFIFITLVLSFLLFSGWWAQKYDGVRLFITVFPFLIIMAASGVYAISKKMRSAVVFLLISCLSLTVLYQTWQVHPYEMSYYNELAGGVSGAKAKGFETEYWATSYKAVIPYIRQYPSEIYCVYPFDAIFIHYQHIGALSTDTLFKEQNINDAQNSLSCSRLILLSRQGVFGDRTSEYWNFFSFQKPLFKVTVDSVQLVGVYVYPLQKK